MALSATIKTPLVSFTQPLGLYIDGQWVRGQSGQTFETINPATEEVIAAVHEATAEGIANTMVLQQYT
jgi:aldehyde dehydrogenase (NAD+)